MNTTTGTARTWGLATIGIVVVLLAASWFLLVSPVLAEAAQTRDATEQQKAQNDIARQQVAVLRADFARMDEYQAQLAALQEQVTTTQRYADMQRLIAAIAEEHGVIVNSLAFGTAEELKAPLPPEPEVTDEEAVEEAAADEAATDEDEEAEPTPPPPPPFVNLYSISVSVEFTGLYSDVLAAIDALQSTESQRLILVKSVALSSEEMLEVDFLSAQAIGSSDDAGNVDSETDAAGSEDADDADAAADAELIDVTVARLEGQTFVLADADELAERAAPGEQEPADGELMQQPQPLPHSDENPLLQREQEDD